MKLQACSYAIDEINKVIKRQRDLVGPDGNTPLLTYLKRERDELLNMELEDCPYTMKQRNDIQWAKNYMEKVNGGLHNVLQTLTRCDNKNNPVSPKHMKDAMGYFEQAAEKMQGFKEEE